MNPDIDDRFDRLEEWLANLEQRIDGIDAYERRRQLVAVPDEHDAT